MAVDNTKAATILASVVVLAKLDIQESSRSSQPFSIVGIPCLIAFRGGNIIRRVE